MYNTDTTAGVNSPQLQAHWHLHWVRLTPLRYRGYYYDSETALYYLQSCYYDSEVGRFISADGYFSTGQGIIGNNMFTYCGNNPINRQDESGCFWKKVGNFFKGVVSLLKSSFGAEYSMVTVKEEDVKIDTKHYSPISVKVGAKGITTVSSKGNSSKPISVYAEERLDNRKKSSIGMKINVSKYSVIMKVGMDDVSLSAHTTKNNITCSSSIKLNISELKLGFEFSEKIKTNDYLSEISYCNISVDGLWLLAAYAIANGLPFENVQQNVPAGAY